MRLAHAFAMESDFVKADMVEAMEFPHLTYKYAVQGVPRTVVNEKGFIEGAMPEARFLDEVLKVIGSGDGNG